jgi:hypothetical protein
MFLEVLGSLHITSRYPSKQKESPRYRPFFNVHSDVNFAPLQIKKDHMKKLANVRLFFNLAWSRTGHIAWAGIYLLIFPL